MNAFVGVRLPTARFSTALARVVELADTRDFEPLHADTECSNRKVGSRIGLFAGNPEYPEVPAATTVPDDPEKGKNPQVQTISREAVVGPSETIRPTPGIYREMI